MPSLIQHSRMPLMLHPYFIYHMRSTSRRLENIKRKSGTPLQNKHGTVGHLSTKVGQSDSIEWRRSKILELSSDGYNQREISQKLQITKSVVNRDVIFLRKQARENLQYHIQDRIPEEYQNCMTGMKRNLKQTLEIAESTSDPEQNYRHVR